MHCCVFLKWSACCGEILFENNSNNTRNAFCGMWYLPRSWIHYDRHTINLVFMSQLLVYLQQTRLLSPLLEQAKKFTIIDIHRRVPRPWFPVRCGNFSNYAINKGYIAYFFNVHAHNCLISTSGLKSDVTTMLLDPNFLYGMGILAIRKHLRHKLAYLFALIFRTFWPKTAVFLGQNRGSGGAMLTLNELVLAFWGSYLCATFGENRSRNATMRVRTDRQTMDYIVARNLQTS